MLLWEQVSRTEISLPTKCVYNNNFVIDVVGFVFFISLFRNTVYNDLQNNKVLKCDLNE